MCHGKVDQGFEREARRLRQDGERRQREETRRFSGRKDAAKERQSVTGKVKEIAGSR